MAPGIRAPYTATRLSAWKMSVEVGNRRITRRAEMSSRTGHCDRALTHNRHRRCDCIAMHKPMRRAENWYSLGISSCWQPSCRRVGRPSSNLLRGYNGPGPQRATYQRKPTGRKRCLALLARSLGMIGFAAIVAAPTAWAQDAPPIRVRGTIERSRTPFM